MRLEQNENCMRILEGYLAIQKGLHGISTIYQERFAIRIYMEDCLRKGATLGRLANDLLTFTEHRPQNDKSSFNFLKCFVFFLCWKHRYQNSKTVRKLMSRFWYFSQSFHNLFDNIHILPFLQPSRRKETLEKLEYFLKHSARLEVPTRDGSMRFVDAYMAGEETPLALACRFRQPAVVLLLLRYGAKTDLPDSRHEFSNCVEVLMTSLYFVFPSESDVLAVERCLRYISRAVEQISFRRLEHRLADNMYQPSHPRWRSIIPETRYREPADLQHLCRCSIRERLNSNYALPSGIEKLCLPNRIKMYLDLTLD